MNVTKDKESHLPEGTLLQGGKYRIVRFIGSGGFGCTYEAEHTELKEKVAIKEFFVKDFCNRDGETSRITVGTESKRLLVTKLLMKFKDEARSLYRLRHPGIVRVSDVFEENGTAYYVMDYIEGRSLQDIVKAEGRLTEERSLKYIREVSEALSYVHSHNRLHLDIKPGNIMIDGNDHAILIDFGASKQYDEASGENTSTLMGRTPGYAPPEQMSNSVTRFLPATDIYALGATLYKLLTGETPIDSTLLASGGEELEPLPSTVHDSTRRAVFTAMELNKGRRPQSVKEFLAILDGSFDPDWPEESTVFGTGSERTELWDETAHHLDLKVKEKKKSKENKADDGRHNKRVKKPKSKRWFLAIEFTLLSVLILAILYSSIQYLPAYIKFLRSEDPQPSECVDLGLSVKWARCNLGATSPYDYGNYYAWGELSPKVIYAYINSRTRQRNILDFSGDVRYDVASAKLGEGWRIPTMPEMKELVEKCRWEWTSVGGHNGYRVTGPSGESIFLPAAGRRVKMRLRLAGSMGGYWTSTQGYTHAFGLYFWGNELGVRWCLRHNGYTVRPVKD